MKRLGLERATKWYNESLKLRVKKTVEKLLALNTKGGYTSTALKVSPWVYERPNLVKECLEEVYPGKVIITRSQGAFLITFKNK